MKEILESSLLTNSVQLSIGNGLAILISSLIAGLILRFVFRKYSTTYSSKSDFGNAILMITISVASLIAVVKSSLALSLGLVGALSVVRFRTAVKEPYNLSFILLSICIGIAIGAGQFTFAFMVGVIGTSAAIYSYRQSGLIKKTKSLNLIDFDTVVTRFPNNSNLDKFYQILSQSTDYFCIQTLDQSSGDPITITVKLRVSNLDIFNQMRNSIISEYPEADLTFYNSPTV